MLVSRRGGYGACSPIATRKQEQSDESRNHGRHIRRHRARSLDPRHRLVDAIAGSQEKSQYRRGLSSLQGDRYRGTAAALTLRSRQACILLPRPWGQRMSMAEDDSGTTSQSQRPVYPNISPFSPQHDKQTWALLEAVIGSSEDAVVSKTKTKNKTTKNATAERLFGFTAEEMIGQSITRVIPEELLHEEADILSKLRRG